MRIRVRESMLVSKQLYDYEKTTILLNNEFDSINGKSERKDYTQ